MTALEIGRKQTFGGVLETETLTSINRQESHKTSTFNKVRAALNTEP
jgi:hypothetical protein